MGKFVAGLAAAAASGRRRLHEGAPVIELRRIAGRQREITTSQGSFTADQVLLATGISMHGPFFYFRRRIIPVGASSSRPSPCPRNMLGDLMPTRRTATTTRNIGHYFRSLLTTVCCSAAARASPCRARPRMRGAADPREEHVGAVSTIARHPHRLLLGRPRRHDGRPTAACRRA